MSQTIEALWNGDIAPCEHCGSHDPEANEMLSLMERNRERLCSKLTDEQAEIFQKYADCAEDYAFRMTALAFQEGFCLGIRLAAESMQA